MNLIINLPGNGVTSPCFNSILQFIAWTNKYKDFKVIMNHSGGSHVGFVRERLMGWHDIREIASKDRSIFDGKWPTYDYILWIDSDIEFTHQHFEYLYDDQQDIVSGYYKMADARNKCCVLEYTPDIPEDEREFMSVEEIQARSQLIETEHAGLGFCLIKQGVFETIHPPYFMEQRVEREGRIAYVGEDVAFFNKARAAGFHVYVDPRVKVNHYKSFLI